MGNKEAEIQRVYEITLDDIHGYLATKGDDEVIGRCVDPFACLAHNTLAWKYGLADDEVEAVSSQAYIHPDGDMETIEFPEKVEEAVSIFDRMKLMDSPVTKAEFMAVWLGR